jgi:hypothetical protein
MLGCDKWLYSYGRPKYGFESHANRRMDHSDCNHPVALGWVALLFFVVFCVIGAQVLLTLFIGIIATAMEEADEEGDAQKVIMVRVRVP